MTWYTQFVVQCLNACHAQLYNLTLAKSMSSSSLLHNIIRSLQGKLYVAEKKNDELQKKVEEQTQEIIRLRDRLANRYSSEEYLIPRRAGSNDFLVSYLFLYS